MADTIVRLAEGNTVVVITDAAAVEVLVGEAEAAAAAASGSATAAATSASSASSAAATAVTAASSASASAIAAGVSADTAEAAEDAVLAALSGTPLSSANIAVASRALLAAAATTAPAILTEGGREGVFVWDSSNLSAEVTADPQQGVYVAPSSDTTGASGAWVRKYDTFVNVRWFGAVGDKVTDDYAAFAAAIAALGSSGGAIFVPEGTYRLSQQLVLTTGVHLVGEHYGRNPGVVQGTTYSFPDYYLGAKLYFDSGVKGIILYSHTDTSDATTVVAELAANGNAAVNWKYQSANFSIVEHLAILSAGGGTTATHGVETRTILHMEDCVVRGFGGNGVEISASSDSTMGGGDDYGNADLSVLSKIYSLGNGADGFHAIGRDANVIKFDSCSAQGNTGRGFNDEGFLGNCYINCQAASNTLDGYRATNLNASHTYFGCYLETGGTAALTSVCTVIGGNLSTQTAAFAASEGAFIQGAGLAIRGAYQHRNYRGATTVGATLGVNDTNMSVLSFGNNPVNTYRDWELVYNGTNRWRMMYGRSTSAIAWQVPDGTNSSGRSYACEFPRGLGLGDQTSTAPSTIMLAGTAAPASGTWVRGDIVFSRSPAAAGSIGWVCTTGGTPGTWKAWGAIDA